MSAAFYSRDSVLFRLKLWHIGCLYVSINNSWLIILLTFENDDDDGYTWWIISTGASL